MVPMNSFLIANRQCVNQFMKDVVTFQVQDGGDYGSSSIEDYAVKEAGARAFSAYEADSVFMETLPRVRRIVYNVINSIGTEIFLLLLFVLDFAGSMYSMLSEPEGKGPAVSEVCMAFATAGYALTRVFPGVCRCGFNRDDC